MFSREDEKVKGYRVNYDYALLLKVEKVEKWGVILTFCLHQVFSHVFSLFQRETWTRRENSPTPIFLPPFFILLPSKRKWHSLILPKIPPTKHIVEFISQFISLN